MFMGVTFYRAAAKQKDEETGKVIDIPESEMKGVINTDCIKLICENKSKPNTTMIAFKDDTPSGLIKGSYEENAKVLFGFNRKL